MSMFSNKNVVEDHEEEQKEDNLRSHRNNDEVRDDDMNLDQMDEHKESISETRMCNL